MAGFNSRTADTSRFGMVPRSDMPRSVYHAEQTLKTTFDAGPLIPIYLDEILPGDTVRLKMTAFCRLATPLFPLMDNLYIDTFFFYVPMRLLWPNAKKFFGEKASPGDSDAYLVPQLVSPAGGFSVGSLADYFGLPTVGQMTAGQTITVNALPFRAYNLIWNEWFRDQNIDTEVQPWNPAVPDGPDTPLYVVTGYNYGALLPRRKRHDYFTSCLPWPEKPQSYDMTQGFSYAGGVPVSGLGAVNTATGAANINVYETGSLGTIYARSKGLWNPTASIDHQVYMKLDGDSYPDVRVTINNLRYAFAMQTLMERNARGGTRYAEFVRAQFGVTSPDFRLQRPEYLGGGSAPISVAPIYQSSATGLSGGATPLGKLGGVGTGVASGHGFSQSFTEHGYIIGLASARADLNYQQGLHKMWSRLTRYDFYTPALAHLGEQAVLRQELYCTGFDVDDNAVFGYQERWAEYRYKQNRITGLFRSTSSGNIDEWHLAQQLGVPGLNGVFLGEDPPIDRVIAVPSEPHFLFDALFSVDHARVMPTFSVPGLGSRF